MNCEKNIYKQFCETDKLCLSCNKPEINEILEISCKATICSYKIINTNHGKKLVVNGSKCIKVLYNSKDSCGKCHCAHFEIPFCEFIELSTICGDVKNVSATVEYKTFCKIDCKKLLVSMIICIDAFVKKEREYCSSNNNCYITEDDCFIEKLDDCE